MFFKRANSVEKQLLNFRNASVSQCFRNSSLTIIWNNLAMSNYKHMKRNLEFRKTVNGSHEQVRLKVFYRYFFYGTPCRKPCSEINR